MAEIRSIDGNPIVIDVNDLGLYQDPETGLVYPVYRGEQSENGIPLAGGGGGGGGAATSVLTVTNKLDWLATTISKGAGCELWLEWSSTDQDIPTGEGTLTVTVDGSRKLTKSVAQGQLRIEVGGYLSTGSQKVKVKIADSYDNSRTITYTVTVVELSMSSAFSTSGTFAAGEPISYTYTPTGAVDKTVHFEVDGTEVATATVTVSGRQQTQAIPAMTHGGHVLKAWFTAEVDGQTVSSNVLRHALVVVDPESTATIIASAWANNGAAQYQTLAIPYRVYTPNSLTSDVTLSVGGRQVASLTVGRAEQTWSVRMDSVGVTQLTIASGGASKTYNVTVAESDIDVHAETADLALHLSSYGRSNAEEHPEAWEDSEHGVSCTLAGFNFVSDGWVADSDGVTALRVSGDARVTVPYRPFATNFATSTGKTIELEFATHDVLDYDAVIMSCMSGGRGFELTAQMARLASEQSSISTQYKEDEHVRIAFVAEKATEDRLLYIYINGIMSGVVQYADGESFAQLTPVDITIGSNSCAVDVYRIRVYDNDLTRYQVLDNWIADTQDVDEMLERYRHNDVYDEYGNIVIAKLPDDLPYLVIEGTLPSSKGDKKTVSGYYVDPVDASKSFSFEGAQIDVQGTSSQYYPRKNYKVKFKGGFVMTASGETAAKWAMRSDSVPTSTFTFKADVASSEGANNVELVRLYDEACPYQTPPQAEDARVRQGIDGFPIVIFHDDGSSVSFVGKYNFNNDKGTPEVFGFEEGDESWEIKNNNSSRTVFKSADFSGTAWLNDFEARYPDTDPAYKDPAKLSALAAWIVSTDRDQATGDALPEPVTYTIPGEGGDPEQVTFTADTSAYRLAKFRAEAPEHFEMDSALFYYLFTELFLMVDSRAKNAFPSFLGGDKWCWLPYDMDTSLGINNEGDLVFGYSLEDTDTVGGDNVYNGQNSVMWCNLRDAFGSELAQMYRDLRSSGALSYYRVESAFEAHQAKWPEAVFNEDSWYKYIDPLVEDGADAYLMMAQGSKAEQRKWWLYNRIRYVDSKYIAGDALTDTINFRAYAKADITITPYADIYPTVRWESYTVSQRGHRGTPSVLPCPMSGDVTDANLIIFSASQLASVGDLSPLNVGLIDFSHATRLQAIKVGDSERTNTHLTSLTVGNNALLGTVDARNCAALETPVDLSGAGNIEHALFGGTRVTSVKLPVGGILKELQLPATVTNLTVRDQGAITSFAMAGYANVTTLWVENSPAIPVGDILAGMSAGRVRIVGLSATMTVAQVDAFYDHLDAGLTGLDENGNDVPKPVVAGTITVHDSVTGAWLADLASRYPTIRVVADHVTCDLRYWTWDGSTLLATDQVADGGDGTYAGTPSRTSTAQYNFTFAGWSRTMGGEADATATRAVDMDRDVYAAYTSTLRTYTVTWKNQDNTTLETDYNVPYGTVPTYDGATPTYGGETATGWTPAVGPITGDTVYLAMYGTVFTKFMSRTLTEIELSGVSKIRDRAFFSYNNLVAASFPDALNIGASAFVSCARLSNISFPAAVSIGDYAFTGCTSLTTVSFPEVTTVGSVAFNRCTKLIDVSLPEATSLGERAFSGCASLTSVGFPKVLRIEQSAFDRCTGLTSVDFPLASYVGNSAFISCSSLTFVSFPSLSYIGIYAFGKCKNLSSVSFPYLSMILSNAFNGCSAITAISFPELNTVGDYAFSSCQNLAVASLPKANSIGAFAFMNCKNLIELHIESVTSVPVLGNGVFTSTPIGGYSDVAGQYGSVYVPASLYSRFLTTRNWSAIASRIVSVAD